MAGLSRAYKRRPKGLPLSSPGLQLWLDSSDASTLFTDSSGTTPATADGDPIGRWSDKSGNARHATQSDGTKKATLKTGIKNSKNVSRFDGANDVLSITPYALGSSPSYSVFVVIYQNGSAFTVWLEGGILNPYFSNMPSITKGFRHQDGSGADFDVSFDNTNAWSIFTYEQNTTNRNFYLNNGSLNAATLSTRAATFENIGASFNGYFWNGDIAELLIYNSFLSNADRESVRNYLNAKWSIY